MFQWMTVLALVAVNALLWFAPAPHGLTVTFFDVGQGDSIFIEGPTGVQVLVDGGRDSSALRALGERLPFWDRSFDAVVATHPDADHIGGLPDILERYDISYILEPGVSNDTKAWNLFLDSVEREMQSGTRHYTARAGQRLILGGGAYADVLYPISDIGSIKDTNAGSIVLHVVYGDTSFMLTGDLPSAQEQELFLQYGYGLHSDVLKAGHHGSKSSSLPDFVESVSPEYGVYSRGCDNTYGHPAPAVVAFYKSLNVKSHDTCEEGTISFSSDGQMIQNQ